MSPPVVERAAVSGSNTQALCPSAVQRSMQSHISLAFELLDRLSSHAWARMPGIPRHAPCSLR